MTTNTPTKITGIYGQKTYHFWHLEQEYFWYVGVEVDEGQPTSTPRKIYLCKPKKEGDVFVPDYIPGISVNHWVIEDHNPDDVRVGLDIEFFPKVNAYLASLGGGTPDEFPIGGTSLEQYDFLVEKGTEFIDGQLRIK
tara:strand:- start:60 stop:473 length:414 start_codon:yes stop_codon:yes gene_type:complete